MRTLIFLSAAAVSLAVCGCSDEATSPLAPSVQLAASFTEGEIRMVYPAANAVLTAGETFFVSAEQQVRSGPRQGRGVVQCSGGDAWIPASNEFAWSAQDVSLTIGPVWLSETGAASMRIVIYEQSPDDPFLTSAAVNVFCTDLIKEIAYVPALLDRP